MVDLLYEILFLFRLGTRLKRENFYEPSQKIDLQYQEMVLPPKVVLALSSVGEQAPEEWKRWPAHRG